MEKLFTPEQVAEYLVVAERTVYEWLRSGRLRGIKLGRLWRIRQADLEAFLQEEDQDKEPLSPEDLEAVRRGIEDLKAGRMKTLEQYEAKRGLGPAR